MDPNELQRKLQTAVDQMLESIDKTVLRPMQKETYEKMATCFDSNTASNRQIQNCVEQSSQKVKMAEQVISNEMKQFQSRLERCSKACEDEVMDRMKYGSGNQQEAEAQMMTCAAKCVDKHLDLLKSVQSQLERDLNNIVRK